MKSIDLLLPALLALTASAHAEDPPAYEPRTSPADAHRDNGGPGATVLGEVRDGRTVLLEPIRTPFGYEWKLRVDGAEYERELHGPIERSFERGAARLRAENTPRMDTEPSGRDGRRTRTLATPPSARERAFGRALGRAFGTSASTRRIVQDYLAPDGESTRFAQARGVSVQLGDGTAVERFFFPSAQDANDYGAHGVDYGDDDGLTETRGRQVVVVRGKGLADPARAAALLDAAWGTLPKPPGKPSATATILPDGSVAMACRGCSPKLKAAFLRALQKAKEKFDQGAEGYERLADDHYAFAIDGGTTGEVRKDADGTLTIASGPDREAFEKMKAQVGRAHPPAVRPVAQGGAGPQPKALERAAGGAAGKLGDLFGR